MIIPSNPALTGFSGIVVAVGVALIVFFWGVMRGERIVAGLLSSYIAIAITSQLTGWQHREWIFIGIYALLLLRFSLSRFSLGISFIGDRWWKTMIFSILQAGLLMSQFLVIRATSTVIPPGVCHPIFIASNSQIAWLVAPAVALLLFAGGNPFSRGRFGR